MSGKIDPLVIEYCQTKNEKLQEQILQKYRPLVEYIARKLAFNRSDTDDLFQIGSLAILKALTRFDSTKDTDFSTFATPTIIGEIKHYFRDKSQLVKVPRKFQELYSKIKTELRESQKEGKDPTVQEMAKKFEVSEETILEAMEVGQHSRILSLDAPAEQKNTSSNREVPLVEQLSTTIKEDHVLSRESIKQAILKLPPRERRIIYLRFYGNLSQADIATRLRLSQMHISRLISKALKNLRRHLNPS